ncbi:MAG: hypothetical protein AAFQ36_01550 [Pseudomonadota bacterium]
MTESTDTFGNTVATATPIALGDVIQGSINTEGDLDHFSLTLTGGTQYYLLLSSDRSDGDSLSGNFGTPDLSVFNAAITSVPLQNGKAWDDETAAMAFTPEDDGTYVIRVSELLDLATGEYTFQIIEATTPDDHSSIWQEATALTLEVEQSGEFELAYDRDWFSINLAAGVEYTVEVSEISDADGFISSLIPAQTTLRVYDGDGNASSIIATRTQESGAVSYTFTAETSEQHYLEVADFRDAYTGTYTIEVSSGSGNAPTNGEATLEGTGFVGTNINANVSSIEDADGIDNISYQWRADLTPIIGATSNSLEISDALAISVIDVIVTVTDDKGVVTVLPPSERILTSNSAEIGTEDNDRLDGSALSDIIKGLGGNDRINTFASNDLIDGGEGNDRIKSGSGDDIVEGREGNDRINTGGGDDFARGGTENDRIKGGGGDDDLNGDFGRDRVQGGSGDDLLGGGWGKDKLNGGSGSDVLIGGIGNDKLTGGGGADIFQFEEGDGEDTITDFTIGTDTIRIIDGPGRFRRLEITDTDDGALVDYETGGFIVEGVAAADLSSSDFEML